MKISLNALISNIGHDRLKKNDNQIRLLSILNLSFIVIKIYHRHQRFKIELNLADRVVTVIWHSLIVYQWPPRLMPSVGHNIIFMSTFHSWIRHSGHHDGCCMRSREYLPFRGT